MRPYVDGIEPEIGTPPWLSHFDHAVVRLATFGSDPASPLRLILATVELLAPGRCPERTGRIEKVRVGDAGAAVFFHRVAMDARNAVAWYLSAADGSLTTPRSDDPGPDGRDRSGRRIRVGACQHEPVWPDLALPSNHDAVAGLDGPGDPAPFVGAGATPARLSRTVAVPDEAVVEALRDVEVCAFLRPRLHVDATRYTECLGGLALVVPDPIVRRVDMFVRPRSGGSSSVEDLVLHVHPRRGIRVDGVEATVVERRAGALVRHEHFMVPPDGLVVLGRRQATAMVGYVLTHRTVGILRSQEPLPFIRGFSIRTAVADRRVSVEAATGESPKAGTETYSGVRYVDDDALDVGRGAEPSALSRIRSAERDREAAGSAVAQGQRWLDEPHRAREYVRSIVARARRRLWIADRYFGWRQIDQFVQASTRTDIEVRLLTSRTMLSGTDPSPTKDGAPVDRGHCFVAALNELERTGFKDVRVLFAMDEASELHDRFLVIDDEAWFCGTSLHAVGNRLSLVSRVPSPSSVISRLDGLMRRAAEMREVIAVHARTEEVTGDATQGGDR